MFPEMVRDTSSGNAPKKGSSNHVTLNVVRHASTDIDDKASTHGWIDAPLNDKGVKESIEAAKRFRDIPVDRLYSSDLQRARQTASMIAGHTGAKLVTQFGLRPIDMGKLSGKKHEENQEEMQKLYERWKTDPTVKIPEGESFKDFENRNLGTIQSILQGSKPGEHLAIVGHAITSALLKGYAKKGEVSPLQNSEIAEISKNEKAPMHSTYSYNPVSRVFTHG